MKMKKHEQGKKYSILSNVGWMVNLSWHTSKAAFLLCLAASSLEVLLQLTNLYIAPQILRQVEQHVPLSHLLLTIGGFTAALFLLMGLKEYVKINVRFPRITVRTHIIGKIEEKNNTTSYLSFRSSVHRTPNQSCCLYTTLKKCPKYKEFYLFLV